MPPRADFKWKPIEKWPGPWKKSDLPEVFAEFKAHLDPEALNAYMDRAAREWSIETGQIEGAYDIERGATTALIEEGFNAAKINHQSNGLSQEEVYAILLDTKAALDGVYEFIKGDRPLTPHYIRTLHQQLMNNIDSRDVLVRDPISGLTRKEKLPLRKGEYKEELNNPTREDGSVHEYCPPLDVPFQMERLIVLYAEMQTDGAPPEALAAWLHYAFVLIHPFEDGNGRVARILATIVLIKAGLPPFTVIRDMRIRYINTLESADSGDRQPLLDFFESCLYRQTFLLWSEIRLKPPSPLTSEASLDEILQHAAAKLKVMQNRLPDKWEATNTFLSRQTPRLMEAMQLFAARIHQDLAAYGVTTRQVGTTNVSSQDCASIAASELWGLIAISRVTSNLNGIVITIDGPRPARIFLWQDRFNEQRSGLAALRVSLDDQQSHFNHISPPFFIHFLHAESEDLYLWLNRSLKKALHFWQQTLP